MMLTLVGEQKSRMTWAEAEAIIAEHKAEYERLVDNGIIPGGNYKVRPLTAEDIDRAAGTLAAIMAIPSMASGFVTFDDGLEGGWWYERESAVDCEWVVLVRLPDSPDPEACRAAVWEGIEAARAEVWDSIARDREKGEQPSREDALYLRALEVA
jgi:hypothetical protein